VFAILPLPGATAADLSIVLACQALPQLVSVLAAGVVGERFSRCRLMVGADLLIAFAWKAIAEMVLTRHAPARPAEWGNRPGPPRFGLGQRSTSLSWGERQPPDE
jgi:hypothetical protein